MKPKKPSIPVSDIVARREKIQKELGETEARVVFLRGAVAALVDAVRVVEAPAA